MLLWTLLPSSATAGPAFTCTADAYMSIAASSTANTSLSKVAKSGASYILQPQGSGSNYNALGYNSVDNYMYAIGNSQSLLRVSSDGTTENLGNVTNLPAVNGFRYIAADMDASGNLYVADDPTSASDPLESIYVVNISSVSVTETISINPAIPSATNTFDNRYSGSYINDLAYSLADSHIYAFIQSGHLYKINPATGASTLLGSTIGAPGSETNTSSGIFGAVFADQYGGLYGIDNITGDLYSFDRTTGAMTYLAPAQTGTFNDGAACGLARLFAEYDFGDAPASYGNASHIILANPTAYFGVNAGDADTTSQSNAAANGDDDDGTDDEDGATSLPSLTTNDTDYSATLDCVVNPADGADIYAWLDTDQDNTFNDEVAVRAACESGKVTFNWTGLSELTTGTTYARFRIIDSNEAGVGATGLPTGSELNGEVEDYAVTIKPGWPTPPVSGPGDGGECVLTHHQNSGVNAEPNSFYSISDHTDPAVLTKIGPWDVPDGTVEGLTADVANGIYYALNGDRNGKLVLGALDLTTGSFADITTGGGFSTLSHSVHGILSIDESRAIAHRPATNELWVAAYRTQPTTGPGSSYGYLFKLNATNGQVISGAFSGEDYIAIDLAPYDLDNTGSKSTLEALTFYKNEADILYGVVSTDQGSGSPKTGHLFAIDLSSSTPQVVLAPNNLSGVAYTSGAAPTSAYFDIEGMAFDENGDLVIVSANVGGSNKNSLLTVDLATGIASNKRSILSGDWEGIVCALPIEKDYGDAPITGTAPNGSDTNNYGSASHQFVRALRLGAEKDSDNANQPSANADDDDKDGNDDDDGIDISPLTKGASATITATVAGADGYLQGWIDWNGDGNFDNSAGSNEIVAVDLQDNANGGAVNNTDTDASTGKIVFSVAVPADATSNQTFARFRWSTTQGLDSTTAAGDGEVEDYALTIGSKDYGDAPGYGDAVHTIDGLTYLGTSPDAEADTVTKNGDASDDANDDGVFTDVGLSAGLQGTALEIEESYTLYIPVVGSGNLSAWIDWNADGDFLDTGEQIANTVAASDETLELMGDVPMYALGGNTYARFRFSSDAAAANPTGTANNGEVEDYQVTINNSRAWASRAAAGSCSANWTAVGNTYQSQTGQGVTITATSNAGANSSWSFAPNDALNANGVFSDSSFNGAPSLNTTFFWDTSPEDGRNDQAATDSETGTLTFSFSVPVKDPVLHIDRIGGFGGDANATPQQLSNSAKITANSANASATFTQLAGTAHFNVTSNDIQRTPNEALVFGNSSSESGTDRTRFTAMGSVKINGTYNSLSLDFDGVGVEGAGADGIEFVICAYPYDYGDAPASYGAVDHRIPDGDSVYLGTVAAEGDPAMQGNDGSGDDNDGTDDEDGVANFPLLNTDSSDYSLNVVVNNNSGKTANLVGWVDFDGNGLFDTDETVTAAVSTGTNNQTIALTWLNLPADIKPGTSYVRLRLTTDTLIATGDTTTSTPVGTADDGEVEDYAITIGDGGYTLSGTVFHDLNVNTNHDSEPGIANVTVVLYDQVTGTCRSTQTTANGDYRFADVLPAAANNYIVYEAAAEDYQSPSACPPVASDPNSFVSSTNNTQTVTVTDMDISDIDFGDVKQPNFTLDNSQVILPHTTVTYPHRFYSDVDGTVLFSISHQIADPADLNWGVQLYLDTNCDAQLDGGDMVITGSIAVNAGDTRCVLSKVLAPASASSGATHTLTIQSNFIYGSSGSAISNAIQTRTDITTTSSGTSAEPIGGEGKLSLIKSVWNATVGNTVGDNNGSSALPNDTLRYTITYQNIGNGALDDLVIHDTIPEFTVLGGAGQQCGNTPSGLNSCIPTESNGELDWTFSGQLLPGAEGEVFYEVIVD